MSEQMLKQILAKLDSVESGIDGLRADVSNIKSDVAGLKTDVAGLKTDVAGLKTDVAVLKTDVSSLKSGQQEHTLLLKALEHRVEENTAAINNMHESLDAMSGRITRLEERQLNVEAGLGQLTGKVSAVENKVIYILDKLQEHDMEIHRLKRAQ